MRSIYILICFSFWFASVAMNSDLQEQNNDEDAPPYISYQLAYNRASKNDKSSVINQPEYRKVKKAVETILKRKDLEGIEPLEAISALLVAFANKSLRKTLEDNLALQQAFIEKTKAYNFAEKIDKTSRNRIFKQFRKNEILGLLEELGFAGNEKKLDKKTIMNGEYEVLQAGDILCEQGEDSDSMYFIIKGSLRVEVNGNAVALIEARKSAGETGLLTREQGSRIATLIADEYTEIFKLSYEKLREIFTFKSYLNLLKTSVQRFINTEIGACNNEEIGSFGEFDWEEHFSSKESLEITPSDQIAGKGIFLIEEGSIIIIKDDNNVMGIKHEGVFGIESLFKGKKNNNIKYFAGKDGVTLRFIPKSEFLASESLEGVKNLVGNMNNLMNRANSLVIRDLVNENYRQIKKGIKNSEFFGPLVSKNDLSALFREGEVFSLKKGDVICEQGEEAGEMFLIMDGKVEVYVNDQFVTNFEQNAIVGEFAWANRGSRSATLIAAENNTKIYCLSYDTIDSEIGERYKYLKEVIKAVANKACKTFINQAFEEMLTSENTEYVLDAWESISESGSLKSSRKSFRKSFRKSSKNLRKSSKKNCDMTATEIITIEHDDPFKESGVVWLIEEGSVCLYKNEIPFGTKGKGQLIGLERAFANKESKTKGKIDVRLNTDEVKVKKISYKQFLKWCKQDPNLAWIVLQEITNLIIAQNNCILHQ